MLRILGFGVLLILSGLGSFSQTVPDQGFFEDGTSALEVKAFSLPLDDRGAAVNCYVVWHPDSRRAVVIDPGAPAPAVLEFIRERHLQALAILNTHGHYDHVGGDAFLSEKLSVPVYVHRADSDLASLTTGSGFPFTFYPEAGKLILGDLEIVVIPTPGHTPGSVCLRIGETIFSGDTLFAGAIGKAEGDSEAKRQANLQLEVQNIRKFLLTLPPTTRVFPGHGPATTIGAEKAFNPYIIE